MPLGCCIGGSRLDVVRLSSSNPALLSLDVDLGAAGRHCRLPFRNRIKICLYSSESAH
jgi:hypothetical protein